MSLLISQVPPNTNTAKTINASSSASLLLRMSRGKLLSSTATTTFSTATVVTVSPSVDASTPSRFYLNSSASTSVSGTSASFTPPQGSLIVVYAAGVNASYANCVLTVTTATGTSGPWTTRVQSYDAGTSSTFVAVATAVATGGAITVNVSVTCFASALTTTSQATAWVEVYNNASGVSVGTPTYLVSTASTNIGISKTTTANNSLMTAVVADQAGAPFTSTDVMDLDPSDMAFIRKAAATPTSGTAVGVNCVAAAGGGEAYGYVASEILFGRIPQWSTTSKSSLQTLSNSNLTTTATVNQPTPNQPVRCTTSISGTDKKYWEVHIDAFTMEQASGIANATWDAVNGWVGDTANSIGYATNGSVNKSAAALTTYATYTTGDTLMFAVDFTNAKVWMGKNGTWNGTPDTNTGGISISGMGAVFPAFYAYDFTTGSPDVVTANFGSSAFTYTVPTGFTGLATVGGAGGSTFTQNVTATATAALTLVRALSRGIAVTISATGAYTLAKAISIARPISATASYTLTRSVGAIKTYTASGALTATALKSRLTTLTYTASQALTLATITARNRTLSFAGTAAYTLTRALGLTKAFTASEAFTTTTATARPRTLSFSASQAFSTVAIKAKNVALTFSASAALTLTAVNAFVRTLTASSSAALSQVRALGVTKAFSASGALTSLQTAAHNVALTFSAAMSAVITPVKISGGLTLTYTASAAFSVVKSTGKVLSYVSSGAVALTRALGLQKLFSPSAALTLTRAAAHNAALTFSASAAAVVSAIKANTANITASATAALSVTRALALQKLFSAAQAFTTATITARSRLIAFAASAAANITAVKGSNDVTVPLTATAALTATTSKVRGLLAYIFVTQSTSVIKSFPYRMIFSANNVASISRGTSLVRSLSASAALTLTRVFSRPLSLAFSIAGAFTVVSIRAYGRVISLGVATTSSISRVVAQSRVFLFSMANPLVLRRAITIGRPSFTATASLSVAPGAVRPKSIAFTATQALTLALTKARQFALTFAATATLTRQRTIGVTKLGVNYAYAMLSRGFALTRTATATQTLTTLAGRIRGLTLSFAASAALVLTKIKTLGPVFPIPYHPSQTREYDTDLDNATRQAMAPRISSAIAKACRLVTAPVSAPDNSTAPQHPGITTPGREPYPPQ